MLGNFFFGVNASHFSWVSIVYFLSVQISRGLFSINVALDALGQSIIYFNKFRTPNWLLQSPQGGRSCKNNSIEQPSRKPSFLQDNETVCLPCRAPRHAIADDPDARVYSHPVGCITFWVVQRLSRSSTAKRVCAWGYDILPYPAAQALEDAGGTQSQPKFAEVCRYLQRMSRSVYRFLCAFGISHLCTCCMCGCCWVYKYEAARQQVCFASSSRHNASNMVVSMVNSKKHWRCSPLSITGVSMHRIESSRLFMMMALPWLNHKDSDPRFIFHGKSWGAYGSQEFIAFLPSNGGKKGIPFIEAFIKEFLYLYVLITFYIIFQNLLKHLEAGAIRIFFSKHLFLHFYP